MTHFLVLLFMLGLTPLFAAGQGNTSTDRIDLRRFLAGFEVVALPFHIDPPNPFYLEDKPDVDSLWRDKYLNHEAFSDVEGFKYGHILHGAENFYVVSVLGMQYTMDTWFVLTLGKKGEIIDVRDVASFIGYKGNLNEQAAWIARNLEIRIDEVYRYYSDSYITMETCSKEEYKLQIMPTGEIKQLGDVKEYSCE